MDEVQILESSRLREKESPSPETYARIRSMQKSSTFFDWICEEGKSRRRPILGSSSASVPIATGTVEDRSLGQTTTTETENAYKMSAAHIISDQPKFVTENLGHRAERSGEQEYDSSSCPPVQLSLRLKPPTSPKVKRMKETKVGRLLFKTPPNFEYPATDSDEEIIMRTRRKNTSINEKIQGKSVKSTTNPPRQRPEECSSNLHNVQTPRAISKSTPIISQDINTTTANSTSNENTQASKPRRFCKGRTANGGICRHTRVYDHGYCPVHTYLLYGDKKDVEREPGQVSMRRRSERSEGVSRRPSHTNCNADSPEQRASKRRRRSMPVTVEVSSSEGDKDSVEVKDRDWEPEEDRIEPVFHKSGADSRRVFLLPRSPVTFQDKCSVGEPNQEKSGMLATTECPSDEDETLEVPSPKNVRLKNHDKQAQRKKGRQMREKSTHQHGRKTLESIARFHGKVALEPGQRKFERARTGSTGLLQDRPQTGAIARECSPAARVPSFSGQVRPGSSDGELHNPRGREFRATHGNVETSMEELRISMRSRGTNPDSMVGLKEEARKRRAERAAMELFEEATADRDSKVDDGMARRLSSNSADKDITSLRKRKGLEVHKPPHDATTAEAGRSGGVGLRDGIHERQRRLFARSSMTRVHHTDHEEEQIAEIMRRDVRASLASSSHSQRIRREDCQSERHSRAFQAPQT